jgi:hypothetical protein
MRPWAVGLGFLLFWTRIIDTRAQVTVTPTDTIFRAAYCAAAIDVIRRERNRDAFERPYIGQNPLADQVLSVVDRPAKA